MNDRKEKCRHDDATNRVHRSSKVLALALGLLVCVPLGGWAGNNLSPLPATSSGQSSSSAQQKNGNAANKNTVAVSGVVRDDQGEPLPGAVVRVVGNQSIAMVTDISGAFKLSVPANATLEVSSIGFKTKQVKAGKGGSLTVDMGEDPPLLNEVVVVGYGQMRRKDITTAVSSVSTKDIDERPIINAGEALQGKAVGIQVVQPSGMPGSGISVRVRGTTSVQASNEPLYIVDGRPVDDISDLSPNDIESIQILKDASSAAIYGARAANGVVLIETRHGKDGKSQIKFSTYVGFSKLGKKIDALNTEEYKDLMKDLKQYMNTAPTIPDSEMRYTDWSDLFFKTGVDQNYQLPVSNGNDKVQYYVSGGFTNQKGIVHKANFRRYNFHDRYLLTVNFRADGSSRFAPGHRWGYFPSVSAGWRISEEPFFKPAKKVFDDVKLRVGWGMNGNQGGIGNYSYLASMTASRVNPTTDNLYPGMSIRPNSTANSELTWEKTTQMNVGLDLALFNFRLIFAADAYYKKTRDLLLTVSLPDYVNLPGGITRNDGEMVNKGFEFEITSHNFPGAFKWDIEFNISFNHNELTKLGLNKVYYYADTYEMHEPAIILKEGLPLGTFFGYISEGVDPETGNIIYKDLNNNGSLDPGDRTTLGNAQPDFIYGMTNTLSWRGWGLSVFLQGSQGNKIFNESRIDMEGMTDFRNQSHVVVDRWRRPGMITDIPRAGNTENNHNSSRFVEDGSYLRVKSLTLSYDFSGNWMKKLSLSKLQLYATAQNLLTLTKYKGFDPEVNTFGSSSVQLGVDYGIYPQSKAWIFGLNVNF